MVHVSCNLTLLSRVFVVRMICNACGLRDRGGHLAHNLNETPAGHLGLWGSGSKICYLTAQSLRCDHIIERGSNCCLRCFLDEKGILTDHKSQAIVCKEAHAICFHEENIF